MPRQSAARAKAARKNKAGMRKSVAGKKPAAKRGGMAEGTGLRPGFRDGYFFHSQVRVGKPGPDGRPTAMILTKFRTMKLGSHKRFYARNGIAGEDVTRIGKILRKFFHADEFPQVIDLLNGRLRLVGWRPLAKADYRRLPGEIKKFYDEFGPALFGIQYACKNARPSGKELVETVREYIKLYKQSPVFADRTFMQRIIRNCFGREGSLGEIEGFKPLASL